MLILCCHLLTSGYLLPSLFPYILCFQFRCCSCNKQSENITTEIFVRCICGMRQKVKSLRQTISTTLTLNDGMRIHRVRVPQDILTAYVNKQGEKRLAVKERPARRIIAKCRRSIPEYRKYKGPIDGLM